MAKLFGYPINLEAEEEEGCGGGGGSSISVEASRFATQPNDKAMSSSAGLQSNPDPRFLDSGSSPMDSESDLDNFFIDFIGRESHEIETVGELFTGRNQMCDEGFGDMEEDESIELGLGIGAGSGSDQLRGDSVTGNKEIDSGRVEVGADLTPFEDDLFCEEEAMLMMADEEWENLQNDITWESDPLQATLFSPVEEQEEDEEEEDEEEEEEGEELDLPSNANPFLENLDESQVFSPVNDDIGDFYEESLDVDDIMMQAVEGSSLLDLDYRDIIQQLGGDFFDDFVTHSFNQQPPTTTTIMGTRPASKRVVDDLPVVEITSEELSKGSIVCAICIGDVVVEEKVRRLPCRHYYHGECLVPWLGMKNTCPVCRYELPTDDLEYERNRRSQRQGT